MPWCDESPACFLLCGVKTSSSPVLTSVQHARNAVALSGTKDRLVLVSLKLIDRERLWLMFLVEDYVDGGRVEMQPPMTTWHGHICTIQDRGSDAKP